jgi:hypothetical protein
MIYSYDTGPLLKFTEIPTEIYLNTVISDSLLQTLNLRRIRGFRQRVNEPYSACFSSSSQTTDIEFKKIKTLGGFRQRVNDPYWACFSSSSKTANMLPKENK